MNIEKGEKRLEAINRLHALSEAFHLGNEALDKFNNNKICVSSETSVKSLFVDDRYVRIVNKFEQDNNALVYMALESGAMEGFLTLSLLYVSDFKGEWKKESLQPNGEILAYESVVDDQMEGGFGNDTVSIKLSSVGGRLIKLA